MLGFKEAWQIAKSSNEHESKCSFVERKGTALCDCKVLKENPKYNEEPKGFEIPESDDD